MVTHITNNSGITPKEDTLVFYHAKCTDGFTGAYAAYKKFGDKAAYIALDYPKDDNDTSTALHKTNVTGKNVIMIDISTNEQTIKKVQSEAATFQLLDHHKSAFEKIGHCAHCFFDLKRSGAMIAWNHFHDKPAPKFIEYVQDGDLWTKKFKETDAFGAVVHNMPHDFALWEKLEDPAYLENVLEKGKILRGQFNTFVDAMVANSKQIKFMGKDIYISNCPGEFTSETGNILATMTNSFAICWSERSDHVKVSLRSVNSFDCSKIAEQFNGGGHPQACAFKVSNLEEFTKLLKDYENTPMPNTEVVHQPVKFKFKRG